MYKQFVKGCIYSFILFIAMGFIGSQNARADIMVVTNFFPTINATEVCADTKLRITFNTTPIIATAGTLQICKVSDDSVVWQLDLQVLPVDAYGPKAGGWPDAYRINLDGLPLNYLPFTITGKTLEIYPATQLSYNTAYYVKMTAGFCTDASSNISPGLTDNTSWRFTTKSAPAASHDYLVASDGSGDFCTLQGASDAVANNDTTRTIIKVKAGTYDGIVYVPTAKTNITWLGENRNTTIISAYNRNDFQTSGGTANRMAVRIDAAGFRMYNVTFLNTTPDGGTQAETISHGGQKYIADNCKYLSYQDTILFNGLEYLNNCYIEGDTDFIWGYGTAYFNHCEIKSLTTSTSYITQPRTPTASQNGFFFVDCNLTGGPGVSGCWFTRLFSGYPYAQVAYINCIMPSTLIAPVGWNPNNEGDLTHLRLWEYKSVDPSGNLINVSSRLTPGSSQLSDVNAAYWRNINNVYSVSGWDPTIVNAPTAAWLPVPADTATGVATAGVTLTWVAGAEATSHDVYFGTAASPPLVVSNQTTTTYNTGAMDNNTTYYWQVDEKNSAGTTTGTVWSFTSADINDSTPPTPNPMTWAVKPAAVGISILAMTATTAADAAGVEYYFTNVTDSNHNSGWQDSPTYIDNGLVNNTSYTYKVKARDKSAKQNMTTDSSEESATTLRYSCGSFPTADFDKDCQVNFKDFAIFADAWSWPKLSGNHLTNGTFDSDLTPWQLVNGTGPLGTVTVTFDGSRGLPAGSAFLYGDSNPNSFAGHYFCQLIPVTVGKKYKFTGKWSGSFYDPNTSTRRNWVQVIIGFSPDTTPSVWGTAYYQKRFISTGNASNMNFPSDSNGRWDWEEITASPHTTNIPPADGVFTAIQPYMVVSFNMCGNAQGGGTSNITKTFLDNISIVERYCYSAEDLNGDCLLDLLDARVLAEQWLSCNRTPSSECWK